MVQRVLAAGGHYILICGAEYTQVEIQKRREAIVESLRGAGVEVDDSLVRFWDAGQVATWANLHPSVAAWVREKTQSTGMEPFRTWDHWVGRSEHAVTKWVSDERLPDLRKWLQGRLGSPRAAVRVVGSWGDWQVSACSEGSGA